MIVDGHGNPNCAEPFADRGNPCVFALGYAEGREKPHFLNVPMVTIVAAVALMNLRTSHFAMYIKIFAALFAIIMWFLAYRFREQGPVVGAVLMGLAAIMILSG